MARKAFVEKPSSSSKAKQTASALSEGLVLKTACLHTEMVDEREGREQAKLLSPRQVIRGVMGSLYPHGSLQESRLLLAAPSWGVGTQRVIFFPP